MGNVLQNGKGVIQNHVDFSKDGNYKVSYDHKHRTYKCNKHKKYAQLIKHLYQNLDPKEFYLLKLNDEEVKVTNLKFMKMWSKYSKVSHQENDVVKCGDCYDNSNEKILVSIGSTKIKIVAKLFQM